MGVDIGYFKSPAGIIRLVLILFLFICVFLAGTYANCWTWNGSNRSIEEDKTTNTGPNVRDGWTYRHCTSIFYAPFSQSYNRGFAYLTTICAVFLCLLVILLVVRLMSPAPGPGLTLVDFIVAVCGVFCFIVGFSWASADCAQVFLWTGREPDAGDNLYVQNTYGQGVAAAVFAAVIFVLFCAEAAFAFMKWRSESNVTNIHVDGGRSAPANK